MSQPSNGKRVTGDSPVKLVPQSHGGALKVGNPGNTGGRPDLAVRVRCRESFAQRIPVLESIADNTEVKPEVRIAAVEKLGRFGLHSEGDRMGAAQFETPEGYKFTLILGDRDHSDD